MKRSNAGEANASDQPENASKSTHEINPAVFRRKLMSWYHANARVLPWRQTSDPYRIWVSEIMLQQTRVAAVIEHYNEFLRRFPTVVALSLAAESEVLAAWSGLGYYRRARMLHKAAQFIVLECGGVLPASSSELRTLPGIGEYTSAAIASIAFGESIAVVDGNVERVLLRLTGRQDDVDAAAAGFEMRSFVRAQAQSLLPPRRATHARAHGVSARRAARADYGIWNAGERVAIAAAAYPEQTAADATLDPGVEGEPSDEGSPGAAPTSPVVRANPAGDHNQAMMELGATVCLPRSPLCHQCPVYALCRTRGEHRSAPRPAQLSRPVAFLLDVRKRGAATEVLLERRAADASIMPSMYELPALPMDVVEGREPVLRLRHAITQTNYYVQVFAVPSRLATKESRAEAGLLRGALPDSTRDLQWIRTFLLGSIPLTGLARKILHRMKLMDGPHMELLR